MKFSPIDTPGLVCVVNDAFLAIIPYPEQTTYRELMLNKLLNQLHSLDEPAWDNHGKFIAYYINGVELKKEEWEIVSHTIKFNNKLDKLT